MQQVPLTETMLEEMAYFADGEPIANEEMTKKNAMALLMKRSSENLPSDTIDDIVAQMVYGNLREPPGDENCPYQKLLLKKDGEEFPGVWIPLNAPCKAMGLKWLFPNVSGPFRLPEETPVPPHLLVGYDAFKYKEVMELSEKYPGAVMKYGFFSSDIPGEGQLITKTVEKFEKKTTPPTYEEKIVIQLVKHSEGFDDFLDLGPSYISPDTVQGEEDCKVFFPPTYDIPEEIILEIKKKPKKKGKSKLLAVVEAHEDKILQADKETTTEVNAENPENEDANLEEPDADDKIPEGEDEEAEDGVEEIDKATSPMADESKTEEST